MDSCWIRAGFVCTVRLGLPEASPGIYGHMGIWAYGQIFRSKCGGAEAVAFSRIFCAGDRGGQEAVCVCGWMMGWIRTGTGPARIMPLGLYSLILSLAPYGQAGAGNPQPPTNKQTTSQPAGSQPAGSGQRTGSSDGRAWSGWDSEISGGSENPSFAPNAVHGLGLGFGVSPHVSLW